MRTRATLCLLCALVAVGVSRPAPAITLHLDYTHDTYVQTNPTAQAALEAAAADVGNALTSVLGAITPADDPIVGSNGSTTATVDWRYSYLDPAASSGSITVNTADVAANTVNIFVGARNIGGTTLGVGGPGGAGFNFPGSGFPSEWIAAVADAEAQQNAIHTRGGGPILGTFNGSSTLGSTTANYSFSYGSSYGSISFDVDTDNNGVRDSDQVLEDAWHFDHTTPPPTGINAKDDFYSVAVHELLHAVGFGTIDPWDALVSGTTWNGPAVQALTGSDGSGLVHTDGAHIAFSKMSPRLSDGVMQEASMDPNLTEGTRKEITLLDLAFMQDIGWNIVPEPGSVTVMLVGTLGILARRRAMKAPPS